MQIPNVLLAVSMISAGFVANAAAPPQIQTQGGKVLPWPASAPFAAVGALLELWPTRLLVGRGGDWFDAGATSESKLVTSVQELSQFYLKSLGNDLGKFSVNTQVVQVGSHGGCLDEGRFVTGYESEDSVFIALGLSGLGDFEVSVTDPRGSAVRSPPFNENFVYVARTGDVVLFPAWAIATIKRHVPTEDTDKTCECISVTGVSVSVSEVALRTPASTVDLLDNRLIINELSIAGPRQYTVGDPKKGLAKFNEQMQHGLGAFPGGRLEVFDLFGSWALRLTLDDVLSMLPAQEQREFDKSTFHEELTKLAYSGLKMPHLKNFAGHKKNGEFFKFQDKAWNAGQPWPELWSAKPFRQLQALFRKAVSYWLALIEEKYTHRNGDNLDNDMFIWAAILGEGLGHDEHHHKGSVVSGIYYVNAPPGSGQLLLKDPRGPYPPFQTGVFPYKPSGGDFVLFPSWLRHQVEGSTFPKESKEPGQATKARRICYAMNYAGERGGEWEKSARVHRHHTLEL